MEIRRATPADLDAIEQIQELSPEAARWKVADYFAQDCWVATLDGVPAGFLVSRDVAGEREILNLAVHPDWRGRGIGQALVIRELKTTASAWFLEVRESNAAAISLYQKAGFRQVGRRPGYYEHPPEGAIVMRLYS